MPRRFTLTDSQVLPISAEKLMAFFSIPENLSRITPESMDFRVVHTTTRPIQEGTVLTYRVRKFGSTHTWKSYIRDWVPGGYFVDVQQQGPFRYWVHRHSLHPVPGGTEVRDELEYELPYGLLGVLAHRLLLRRDIAQSFAYRKQKMEEIFGQMPNI